MRRNRLQRKNQEREHNSGQGVDTKTISRKAEEAVIMYRGRALLDIMLEPLQDSSKKSVVRTRWRE